MSKSKRILLFTFIIVLIGAYVIIPMIDNVGKQDQNDIHISARFSSFDNYVISLGKSKEIIIDNLNEDADMIDLLINDSLIKSWTNPGKKLSWEINSKKFSVGSKELRLLVHSNNQVVFEDSRLFIVLSDTKPIDQVAVVQNITPHVNTHFTQGLEFHNGNLYEGTGQYGQSLIAKIDLSSGNAIQTINVDQKYFGEGITILNNKLYQLTWQEGTCFVYDLQNLNQEKQINYTGEGWGLCNDGNYLIMSDGTERIYFRNPSTFEIVKTIEVYDNKKAIASLNELEFIDGKIYANVWQQNFILVIDPSSGKVLSKINCDNVIARAKGRGEVLNGIAFNKQTKKLYFTGKNWSNIAEVTIK
jgi:glutamine cyclotransferase